MTSNSILLHQPSPANTGILFTFDNTLRLLRADQALRRSMWSEGVFIFIKNQQIYVRSENTETYWHPCQEDILAKDWILWGKRL